MNPQDQNLDDPQNFDDQQNQPTDQNDPDSGGYSFSYPVDTPSVPDQQSSPITQSTTITGLSGNELFCLDLVGYKPGNLVVGNSVYALGFIGEMASNIRTTVGGEIQQFTNMISSGRKLAIERLEQELAQLGADGATGITSDIVFHPGNLEFLSIGSSIFRSDNQTSKVLTSASDGQEFFCQADAGYIPISFVLGNIAYSIGVGRNIMGEIKEIQKGEITQYSNAFNVTRGQALDRIIQEAKDCGANSVIGIKTNILPIGTNQVHEMVMVGTASYNEQVQAMADRCGGVLTSDLTAEETWNITKLGYVPIKLLIGTSVYSIGAVGGIRAAIRGFVKGEITTLTQMLYGAREESLKKVQQQAQEIGANDVIGIKTYIYQLSNNVIEFLVIGTAIVKVNGVTTRSDTIPPQAVIRDKETFVNSAPDTYRTDANQASVTEQEHKNIV